MLHRKYKKLYEDQLANTLMLCNADFTEFMTYVASCNDHYKHDAQFQGLMEALTASEDFDKFRDIMYAAVRENWEPEPDQAAPPPNAQIHQVDIQVPEGCAPGAILPMDYLGFIHQVQVP